MAEWELASNPPCPKCNRPLTVVTESQGRFVTPFLCKYCDFQLSTIKEEAKA